MSNENDFMGGAGSASLKFEKLGDIHKGKIVSIKSRDDREPGGKLKTWDNGEPIKVFLWEIEQEDGSLGTIWVRGNLVSVLREACKKAGAKSQSDLVGAEVLVKHHELGKPSTTGFAPPKLFQAKVTLAPAEQRQPKEFDPFEEA